MRRQKLFTIAGRLRPWSAIALVAALAVLVFGIAQVAHIPPAQTSARSAPRASVDPSGAASGMQPSALASTPNGPQSPRGNMGGNRERATCEGPGQTPCPTPDSGWVPVASESLSDILAAAMSTAMYANEAADPNNHIAGLDAPVLVVPYRAHTGLDYYDDRHYVIRTHDGAGRPSGTFDFIYDRVHHRLRFGGFGLADATDPFYTHPFPPLAPQDQAVSLVSAQRDVGVMPGVAPELIFFPPDPRLSDPRSPLMWSGGGYDPMRPMWHISAADGKDYFVGTDSHVYIDAQLPVASNQAGA